MYYLFPFFITIAYQSPFYLLKLVYVSFCFFYTHFDMTKIFRFLVRVSCIPCCLSAPISHPGCHLLVLLTASIPVLSDCTPTSVAVGPHVEAGGGAGVVVRRRYVPGGVCLASRGRPRRLRLCCAGTGNLAFRSALMRCSLWLGWDLFDRLLIYMLDMGLI